MVAGDWHIKIFLLQDYKGRPGYFTVIYIARHIPAPKGFPWSKCGLENYQPIAEPISIGLNANEEAGTAVKATFLLMSLMERQELRD